MKITNIKYIFLVIKLKFYNKFKKTSGTDKNTSNNMIVNLTTYPARFNVVYITIESLLNQTLKPNRIILWIAKEDIVDKNLPLNIEKLIDRGLDIRIVNENLRSYKKLIYALDEFSGFNLITCDDDVIYPTWFLEKMHDTHKKFPFCVVAYRCTVMRKTCTGKFMPYLEWKTATNYSLPSYDLFPTGVGGVLYPKDSLNEKVVNSKLFMSLSPTADDIWFKAMSLLNNTKVVMVRNRSTNFPVIIGSQKSALWHLNVRKNKNDEQIEKVFSYFSLYKYIDGGGLK